MNIKILQEALKEKRAVIGYRKAIKEIKAGKPKLIIIAKNAPPRFMSEIEDYVKNQKIKMEVYEGSSIELGVLCGKPFPISMIVIKQ